MITKIITLTTIGADAGPTFDLYSDVDNYTTPFETGVSSVALLAGYESSLIPDLTNVIRILSTGVCSLYLDLQIVETVVTCGYPWMLKNLDISTFRNGDTIPQITDPAAWVVAGNAGQPAWCYYNNDPANGPIYGKLYNWHVVNDPRGLAPVGWHIPTETEWDAYIACIGGNLVAGGKMKEAGLDHWIAPNTADNSEGWTGLPGGDRRNNDGGFDLIGSIGFFWSATEGPIVPPFLVPTRAWRYALFNSLNISKNNTTMQQGFSVRCLKD